MKYSVIACDELKKKLGLLVILFVILFSIFHIEEVRAYISSGLENTDIKEDDSGVWWVYFVFKTPFDKDYSAMLGPNWRKFSLWRYI